jgi:hypothetical protein
MIIELNDDETRLLYNLLLEHAQSTIVMRVRPKKQRDYTNWRPDSCAPLENYTQRLRECEIDDRPR